MEKDGFGERTQYSRPVEPVGLLATSKTLTGYPNLSDRYAPNNVNFVASRQPIYSSVAVGGENDLGSTWSLNAGLNASSTMDVLLQSDEKGGVDNHMRPGWESEKPTYHWKSKFGKHTNPIRQERTAKRSSKKVLYMTLGVITGMPSLGLRL